MRNRVRALLAAQSKTRKPGSLSCRERVIDVA
jgi:hypothetical protein